MKKRELLHLHSLLMTVAKECVERDELTADELAAYHEVGVTPMSLQAPREDHQKAVLELSAILADATGERLPDIEPVESVHAE